MWIYLFLIGLIGLGRGSSFFFIYIGIEDSSPITVITLRLIFAGLIAFVFLILIRQLTSAFLVIYLKAGAVIGIVGLALPFYLVAYAERTVETSLAGVITATVPFFTALLVSMIGRQRPASIPWIVLGLTGVVLVYVGGSTTRATGYTTDTLLVVLSVLCYAINNVLIARSTHLDKRVLASTTMITAGVAGVVISLLTSSELLSVSYRSIGVGLVLGSLCTAIPVLALFFAIARFGPVKGSFGVYLIPLVALLLGVTVLSERVTFIQGMGVVLILLAVYLQALRKIG